jgi:hypothetical protein
MKAIKLPIKPDTQYEGHTCGLCAASAVYRYYDMDPEDYELRTYLGTDNILPYNFPARDRIEQWMGGSANMLSGTLPPDMLAVLYWDGFDTQTLSGYTPYVRERLHDHLANGDPALALAFECWHWVVVSGIDDRGLWVADSIMWDERWRSTPTYRMSDARAAQYLHGLILLSRDDEPDERLIREMTYLDFAREYLRGCAWSAAMGGRKIPGWMKLDRLFGPAAKGAA